jgi:NAD(P)-dependent dehydrogenase (short-subunit alcohol dehydrogenase family)
VDPTTVPDLAGALDFSGTVSVVTGGSRGVGAAVVAALLAAGSEVVTCGRHRPGESPVPVAGPDGTVRSAHFVVADVREPDQARSVVAAAIERHGRLDLLVNNAGGSPHVAAAEASPRFVASVVTLNLLAPFTCAQAANEVMQSQEGGGSIVNIGSISGLRPSPGTAAYGAAKAGLINLTGSLAVEWAPKVRVNCVSAGLLDTGGGPEHYGGEEGLARVAATVPLGRLGTPADVAGLCLLLASPLASYVTGANLVAHGGGEWPAFLTAARG